MFAHFMQILSSFYKNHTISFQLNIMSATHFLTAANMWHVWYVTLKVSVYIEAVWVIIQYSWAGRCHFLWQIYCCHLQSVRPGKTTTRIFTAIKISKCIQTISVVERGKGLVVPVLNSLCTIPWRYVQRLSYRSMQSVRWWRMEENGQLHMLAISFPGTNSSQYPVGKRLNACTPLSWVRW
jgi:hypothetical protein